MNVKLRGIGESFLKKPLPYEELSLILLANKTGSALRRYEKIYKTHFDGNFVRNTLFLL